jgi:hypothetical protein
VCCEPCIIRALASLGRVEQKLEMFREGCKIASMLFTLLRQAKGSTVAAQCVVKLVRKAQLHDGRQVPQSIAPSLLLPQEPAKADATEDASGIQIHRLLIASYRLGEQRNIFFTRTSNIVARNITLQVQYICTLCRSIPLDNDTFAFAYRGWG